VKLRPDHVIWVLKYLYRRDGRDDERQHGGSAVLAALSDNLDQPIELVLGEDDICGPCKYNHDGRCTDGLDWTPKIGKQEWVERRDESAMRILGVWPGAAMRAGELFGLFGRQLPLLAALLPSHDYYESDCRKGQRDQVLYAEGLRRVSRDEEPEG
jgi:hypothetical protein